jgi:hypothetical protein
VPTSSGNQTGCAPRGRKHDFKDAERLVRRLMANELILSFVPSGEQRIWRSMTRMIESSPLSLHDLPYFRVVLFTLRCEIVRR